jgi:hypothetical protein
MTNPTTRWRIGRATACRCIDISTFRLVLISHFQIPLRNWRSSGKLWVRNGVWVAELRLIQVSQPHGAWVHFSAATSGPPGRKRRVTGNTIHRLPSVRLNHVELTELRYRPIRSAVWISQSRVTKRKHIHRLMWRHISFQVCACALMADPKSLDHRERDTSCPDKRTSAGVRRR